MEWLEKLDRDFFLFINGKNSSFFDSVFFLSNLVITWVPLYVFFLFLIFRKFKSKTWICVAGAAILILATDQSSVLLKNNVRRYRPSHNLEIKNNVHLIKEEKGGQYGFVSSHAANVWGIAIYIFLLLDLRKKNWIIPILFWAAFVSYGRVYSGVHYPADVLGGALLGIVVALAVYKVVHHFGLAKNKNESITT
ncbi:MAG: phosphatase PAP2 family protein [Bacteroidota bacterium]|jgi:undecaprenyl-diphosphatase